MVAPNGLVDTPFVGMPQSPACAGGGPPWDDDPRWKDIPDRHLLEVTVDGQLLPPDLTNEPRRAVSISLITHLAADDAAAALRADAQFGLTATPKSLPPRWFTRCPIELASCTDRTPRRRRQAPGTTVRSSG